MYIVINFPYNGEEKLKMYQKENIIIEEKIKSTVQSYMNFEISTYKELVESAELETLLIKYPELNSNELVKMEIETYKENNKKIKELKESLIDSKQMKFFLYFGN